MLDIAPMELWQMDVVGGFPLVDGTSAKALTGVDDHSRMCVCGWLMAAERTRAVCDGLRAALAKYGVPQQVLTDNGKVFTGRFHGPHTGIATHNGEAIHASLSLARRSGHRPESATNAGRRCD
jgi:Integrase core domain